MMVKRSLKPFRKLPKGKIVSGDRTYLDFSSNDYLGLSTDEVLLDFLQDLQQMGSAGSRLLGGDSPQFHDLESQLSDWVDKPASLIFNSGYQLNLGVISTLWGSNDVVFMDRSIHASMVDGVRLSGARFYRFRHNDCVHLESLLMEHRSKGDRAVILTESLFSMDGDLPDLMRLVELKYLYSTDLYVDEAHALGVFGDNGSGRVKGLGISNDVDFLVGTFGKSFGSVGGFVGCSQHIKNQLVNSCRSFIYSTALPLSVISWNLKALERIYSLSELSSELLIKSESVRALFKEKGLTVLGESQIVPVMCGEDAIAFDLSKQLKDFGFWVPAIRTPTVPISQSRLRFSLTTQNMSIDFNVIADLIG